MPHRSTLPRLERVAVVVDDGVSPFEFAVACEVFGIDRSEDGLPVFDFRICSPRPGPVASPVGFDLAVPHRLDALAAADLIVVPAMGVDYRPPVELVDRLRAAADRGALIASLCSGAFVLGWAGLLDGRRATTHWRHADELAAQFPSVHLVPDVLFVQDGPIFTSAGTAAGIDLCLHLLRTCHGVGVANAIARRMVVPPQRDGGQAQFVETPVRAATGIGLAPVLDWAARHLDQDLSVAVLAERAAMSQRTFARRFRDETGTTPHTWVLSQRVALAEQLLEAGDLTVEQIAERAGFGSAAMLRHHFRRARATAPMAYRRAFGPVRAS
ncbi:MAG: helix-turn-helix domain-containing protein [Kineosporiaceae bacterium]|nr:helix-turn-helix domain-containing protein [Kineosporiaceae bacterium]MBK7622486.1 helix-turn-helix domain-containing protein [Kineosporiaceae bacterium]